MYFQKGKGLADVFERLLCFEIKSSSEIQSFVKQAHVGS